jgi:hypothetical protein
MTLAQYRALVAAKKAEAPLPPQRPPIKVPKTNEPNETEARWLTDHRHLFHTKAEFRYEALTFRFPTGAIYTPDWTVWAENTLVACIEVKGNHGRRDAGPEKWKQAVIQWPKVMWIFAKWRNDQWDTAKHTPKS